MALSKPVRYAIAALTRRVEKVDIRRQYRLVRHFSRVTHLPLRRPAQRPWEYHVHCGDHEVPVRIYTSETGKCPGGLLLFFHGGGWVSGDVTTYADACVLMARRTGCSVASVEYRLAPEHRFPAGLEDCYAVTQHILLHAGVFCTTQEEVTLIGDSAGGNLAAAVSLLARDRGAVLPQRQILLYPSLYPDHNPATSPFDSVRSNGTDKMLTAQQVEAYTVLYRSKPEDLQNPYFAPLLATDFSRQPATLILTAEYDPLRDEGEAYGEALRAAGGQVMQHRIADALHGFLSLPGFPAPVREAYQWIGDFLNR